MAKVMVVDDSYAETQIIESTLKSGGYQVVALSDGEQIEDKVVSERPDVILLDVVMPKRNGYEVLRALRKDERTKTTPVVMVTSKGQDSDKNWGRRQGADDYVVKPFTPEQLLGAVRRLAR